MFRVACSALVALSLSSISHAQYGMDRADTWEFSVGAVSQASQGFTSTDDKATLNIDKDTGWAVSVGYNFDNNLMLNWELTHNSPSYQTTFPAISTPGGDITQFSHRSDMYSNQFNATWHLFDGPLTPFIKGGIGWTNVDSNVGTGRVACLPGRGWYPRWYCSETTYDENGFSYNAAVGLRYDISPDFFLRGSVQSLWYGSTIGGETPRFNMGKVEFGFRM